MSTHNICFRGAIRKNINTFDIKRMSYLKLWSEYYRICNWHCAGKFKSLFVGLIVTGKVEIYFLLFTENKILETM